MRGPQGHQWQWMPLSSSPPHRVSTSVPSLKSKWFVDYVVSSISKKKGVGSQLWSFTLRASNLLVSRVLWREKHDLHLNPLPTRLYPKSRKLQLPWGLMWRKTTTRWFYTLLSFSKRGSVHYRPCFMIMTVFYHSRGFHVLSQRQ